jgi:phosphoribosylformylglycinamidine (FGAM) synthase-like enzyme
VVGIVGILENVASAMTFHFRQTGRDVLLLSGSPEQSLAEAETAFGSSEYAKEVLGEVWGLPPALDLKQEVALQKCLRELIQKRDVESAHDCSDGGLAVALAESAFVNGTGAKIELASSLFPEAILFGEGASRVLITCDPANTANIQKAALQWGVKADRIGTTIPEKLSISINGSMAVTASVVELKEVWATALQGALDADVPGPASPEILRKS